MFLVQTAPTASATTCLHLQATQCELRGGAGVRGSRGDLHWRVGRRTTSWSYQAQGMGGAEVVFPGGKSVQGNSTFVLSASSRRWPENTIQLLQGTEPKDKGEWGGQAQTGQEVTTEEKDIGIGALRPLVMPSATKLLPIPCSGSHLSLGHQSIVFC